MASSLLLTCHAMSSRFALSTQQRIFASTSNAQQTIHLVGAANDIVLSKIV